MLIEGVLNEVVFEFIIPIVLLESPENNDLNCIIGYCAMWITSSIDLSYTLYIMNFLLLRIIEICENVILLQIYQLQQMMTHRRYEMSKQS